jgi:hypothetical protein
VNVQFAFDATIIHWRGPAPFFYAPVPADAAEEIRRASKLVSYGWGVIPVEAVIAGVTFTTSLFPKDGTYLVPLKDAVRKATGITVDDTIHIELTLQPRR